MPEVTERCTPILYGPERKLRELAEAMHLPLANSIRDFPVEGNVVPGVFSRHTGKASFEAFDWTITDAMAGEVDGIVTGPIQKEAWNLAGIKFPGHTEVLADRTQCEDFCMMLTSETISCVLVTIHVPLGDVPKLLTTQRISKAIELGNQALTSRHGREARVVVCGLNPHSGENGLFSHGEEESVIRPSVDASREAGINVVGPVPPDTAFTPMMRSKTDVYICLYHDQGLIPLKALSFDEAVNVTLGLPIVRTSVDHGTAMNLAWQGKANHTSMLAAINMAADLAANRSVAPGKGGSK